MMLTYMDTSELVSTYILPIYIYMYVYTGIYIYWSVYVCMCIIILPQT